MSELDNIIKELNKNNKVISIGNPDRSDIRKIPFSSPRANYVLYGGLPMERLIEFAGLESSGKSTSALDIVGNYQKLENAKRVLYIDLEGTYDDLWAEKLGVKVNEVIVWSPQEQSAEDIFDYIIKMIKTDEVGLIIIDSLATLVPSQILKENFDKQEMGGISKSLTRFCRTVISLLKKHHTTLIGINQLRDDMNSMWNDYTTPGGKGWKFFCSVRLMFNKGKFFDENLEDLTQNAENPYGNKVEIKVVKSKVCRSDRRKGYYSLTYLNGIDSLGDTLNCAIEFGLIQRRGAWYNLIDLETGEILEDKRFQGINRVREYFSNNEEEYNKLWTRVNELISKE